MVWEDEKRKLAKEIIIELAKIDAIKFGEFTLTSGLKSPYYVDLRLIISYPRLMSKVCSALSKTLKYEVREKVDRIAGVPTAGTPLASLVSVLLEIPMIYVRKEKKEHGTGKRVEGVLKPDDNVVIIDDLITNGKSKLEAIEPVEELKAKVKHIIVVLDREQGGREELKTAGYELHSLAGIREALKWLYEEKLISEKQHEEVRKYIESN
jgi:orotate phosphoribosyltransferase